MKQFLINILGRFRYLHKLKCNHRFLDYEVRDLSIDPKCVFCGKKLTDFK